MNEPAHDSAEVERPIAESNVVTDKETTKLRTKRLRKDSSGKFRLALSLVLVGALSPVLLVNYVSSQRQLHAVQQSVRAIEQTNASLQTELEAVEKKWAAIEVLKSQARTSQNRMLDYLAKCVTVDEIPRFDSEFIFGAERFSGFNGNLVNFVVPAGNHRLLVRVHEMEGQNVKRTQDVEFPLRGAAGYQLLIHTNGHRKDKEDPLRLELLSNVAEFEPVSKTIAVDAEELTYNGNNGGRREFYFPGEVRYNFFSRADADEPSIQVLPQCRFMALPASDKIVELSGYILSDADPCLTPAFASLQVVSMQSSTAETPSPPKYLGGGKFEWTGKVNAPMQSDSAVKRPQD